VHSFTDSLSTVFLIAAAVTAVAFVLAWALEERPLRKTIEDRDVGDAFAPPQDTDSIREITRELSRLVGRERTRSFIEGVIADAEADLSPAEGWLLGRAKDGTIPPDALEARDPANSLILEQALGQLATKGLVESSDPPGRLTPKGVTVRFDLLRARQRSLESLCADWEPDDPEVDAMIVRLSEELAHSGQP
jgi:hypothetical protein